MIERLPMSEMVEGDIYRLRSRNLMVGVWRASSRGFIGIREKFGSLYLFEEYHYEADRHVGTASPIARMGRVPEGVELEEGHIEPDPEREGRSFFVMNQPLFDALKPFDDTAVEEWRVENEQAQIRADSERMAPQTREQFEREQRTAKVREWVAEQRAQGLMYHDFYREFHDRMRRAIAGEGDE